MERRPAEHFDRDLEAALVRGRAMPVPGFAGRVVTAVHADRLRRAVIRWGSGLSAAAACLVAALMLDAPSEEALIVEARSLVAAEESAQFHELLSLADDLALLQPVIERPALIEDLADGGS
ncbi:MAG: hypothetical protein FJ410_08525 [Verrucomicrobia bacterium]|nr:hypothetical protein [Verrucomicrobiota bacterium]